MATNNAINLKSAGIAKYDGNGTFSGISVTNHALLVGASSNGITSVPLTNGQLPIGSTGNDPVAAQLTSTGGTINWTFGPGTINAEVANPSSAANTSNLGIGLSSGTFSMQGANGSALSASNPGYVQIPITPAGTSKVFQVTANQTFIDDNGASTINNNSFGTSSATWTNDTPFYIYAAADNTNANPIFLIARIPHLTTTPAAGVIGKTGSAVATTQGSMFALGNPTVASYASRPCVCIGAFRMTKQSTTDWTVSALSNTDGIGNFLEGVLFTYVTGQMGNSAGKYFANQSSTAPTFGGNNWTYRVSKSGICFVSQQHSMNGTGSSGSGSDGLICYPPYTRDTDWRGQAFGSMQYTAGNPFVPFCPLMLGVNFVQYIFNNSTTNPLLNSTLTNVNGYSFYCSFWYGMSRT